MTPPHLQPFVLPVAEIEPERAGAIDVYRPVEGSAEPLPAIVFVHGGPLPPELQPSPREWPVFRGYGSLAASNGAVGITLDHPLHSTADYATAADALASAVDQARELPGVDSGRVALWFFSGGGLLTADWIGGPPDWLRCVAASYPVLVPPPGWDVDARFRPVEALASAGALPILLTRAGKEEPGFAAGVETFTTEADKRGAKLDVIDVPEGRHSFDILDHAPSSRAAVTQAMAWVTRKLSR
ncbi:alpha/beta hydrolase [Saccharopolyspora gloriosae]|uniref:alpha/beta hydrolase n=1 Tax=Saccharopolyspora gloriosae TaxID=455344 RepID=UPI001FB64343|nr:dienelactone hydrolase family protein [Saccharopolyspora gloriosae]